MKTSYLRTTLACTAVFLIACDHINTPSESSESQHTHTTNQELLDIDPYDSTCTDEGHPDCQTLCQPLTTPPGRPGFCCNDTSGAFTTCLDAGLVIADTDGDSIFDHQDNCETTFNPWQFDANQDGVGDLCQYDGEFHFSTRIDEAMRIDTEFCPDDYGSTRDCINTFAPLKPSLNRGISRGDIHYDVQSPRNFASYKLPIDDTIYTRPKTAGQSSTPSPLRGPQVGNTQILPYFRTSHDHRLIVEGNSVRLYRPEELGRQNRILNPLHTPVSEPDYWTFDYPKIFGVSQISALLFCEATSTPVPCTGLSWASPQAEGDCYDITLMGVDRTTPIPHALSSAPVTIFVERGKEIQASIPQRGGAPVVFPRASHTTSTQEGVHMGGLYRKITDPFHPSFHHATYTSDCGCSDPLLCDPASTEPLNELTELTMTANGKMLVVNSNGVSYSIAKHGAEACKADSFTLFKPLSCLPMDPDAMDYPIAKAARLLPDGTRAFIDSQGEVIPPGRTITGAYPWVDREGRNVFYANINTHRDAWVARHQDPPQDPARIASMLFPNQSTSAKGNGVVGLGAWTQGKVIVMDGVLNATDWTGGVTTVGVPQGGDNMYHNFKMALYAGEPRWIRPAPISRINSTENQLNYFASQSPTSPFDVVWQFSTSHHQHSEVVFDDYLMNNAFVVAHMNAPHVKFLTPTEQALAPIDVKASNYPDDGFVPRDPDTNIALAHHSSQVTNIHNRDVLFNQFKFKRSPKLQNAATSRPEFAPFEGGGPKSMDLLGGARVEPVALGGIKGKGVFLDGMNDHIRMDFANPNHQNWLYGIWLDSREIQGHMRTVFFWGDGSWIGLSNDTIRVHVPDHATPDRSLVHMGLPIGDYFHMAVRVQMLGKDAQLLFYINGTLATSLYITAASAFSMNSLSGERSSFFVGDPGPDYASWGDDAPRKTWRGWVDELRIYALAQHEGDHLEEFICNMAMGSLVGQFGEQPHCEQLDMDPKGHPVDIPQQNDVLCADKVHQSGPQNASCLRRDKIGISPIVSQAPRPDETHNAFCQTCHIDNHPMTELTVLGALGPMPGNREDDPRRLPMDWPAHVTGRYPYHDTTTHGVLPVGWGLDWWLESYLHGGKL